VIIKNQDNVKDKIKKFQFPAIIKAQIAIGSRKKAGLIQIARNENEALKYCGEFFKKNVSGFKVEAILIEDLVQIAHEYYCSITLDASGRRFYIIASAEGGIEIEDVAKNRPNAIIKESFSFSDGLTKDMARKVGEQLGFKNKNLEDLVNIFLNLWKISVENEAQLVEINPLVMTDSELIAVDAKMILDENAAFRKSLTQRFLENKLTKYEKLARDAGFSFVKLDGKIGILANGAGLTMALLDVLSQLGLKPANFLDVGGGASKTRVYKALELIFNLKPDCVFINIFGGITRCDIVAEAIIEALNNFENSPPMVIRLIGTNEKEGLQVLKKEGIDAYRNVMDAIQKVKEVIGE